MNEDLNNQHIKLDESEWYIAEQLHEGGFGRVHLARSDDGEQVVAKLIPKSQGADRELLFDDLNGLANVVPVLDRGQWDNQWVLIMPKAEKSLYDLINEKGGRFEIEEAVKILQNVIKALVEIEDSVVHRDIKPSNILLLNDTWCLADFGISRYAEATTAVDTRKYYMTWPYAAPEQWRSEHATSATDVYATGVMAYELLDGRRPFCGPRMEDYRQQHLRDIPESIEGIPYNLRSLIDECLYKAAESRPTPKNIQQRLQNVVSPVSDAARKLQQANAVVVIRKAEENRQVSIAKTVEERRVELSHMAERSLGHIVGLLNDQIIANAPNVSHSESTWTLNQAKLSLESLESLGSSWRGRIECLPFDVVSFSKITIDIPRTMHGYEGRSHSLWYCNAQKTDEFRWYETAFMYCPLWRKSSTIDPFSLKPEGKAGEALSTVSFTEFQVAWRFTQIDQGNESEFIERWIEWFADGASGRLHRPTHMPENEPGGSWRRS